MELRRMRELIYKSPDIREDMVADLRARIFDGVYEIRADRIVNKIIQHGVHILDLPRESDCCFS